MSQFIFNPSLSPAERAKCGSSNNGDELLVLLVYDNRGSICYLQHLIILDLIIWRHINNEITTFSFWKMSSLGGSFLQVTNNQTKNNGRGGGGGAPSSPRAKGTAAVALHVKFSKCRSAPIMQRFPLSSLMCIRICQAEERRPSKFVL